MEGTTLSPSARAIGRRLRWGYVLVLAGLAAGLGGAALEVRSYLELDAYHAGVVNGAGRQRSLGVRAAEKALLAARHPSPDAITDVDEALAEWAGQQSTIDEKLKPLCADHLALCVDFQALKASHRVAAQQTAMLAREKNAAAIDGAEVALDVEIAAYLTAADRWVGDLAEALAEDTVRQRGRVLTWVLAMLLAAAILATVVLEPIIRRLQRERTTIDADIVVRRRLGAVAEHMHNAVIITDAQGRTEWVNEAFTRLSGFTLKDLIGRAPGQVLQSGDSDGDARAAMRRSVETGERSTTTIVNYTKGRRPYLAQIDIDPLRDDRGVLTGFIAIEADVTARARAQTELAAANRRLTAATQAGHIGLWEADWMQGDRPRALWLDPIGQAMLGLAPMDGRHPWDVITAAIDERDLPGFVAVTKPTQAGTQHFSVRFRTSASGEGLRRLHAQGSIEVDAVDHVVRMYGVLIDETADMEVQARIHEEKHRAEQALWQLESHRRAIDMHAIVAVTDTRGVITYANDRFVAISGYAREELEGRTHAIVNSGTHPRSLWVDLWRTLASGGTWHGELCNRAKSGELYWVDTTITPLRDASGAIVEYIAIRTDVTQHHLNRQRLAADEALARAG